MSLTIAMQSAISSLNAAQLALQVTSSNVSNANTVGYTRKTVNQETRILDGMGAGVFSGNITRSVDASLQQQLRLQSAGSGQYDTLSNYYDQMQNLFGSLDSNSSFVSAIDKFEATLQALGVTPEGVSQRTDVVNAAQNLTQQLASTGSQLQALRRQADNDISDSVSTVNAQLQIIDQLNKAIGRNTALNLPTGDLEDQRDVAIDKVAKEIDITYFMRDNGEVVIFTKGGRTLLDQEPQLLSHSPASGMDAGITHDSGSVDGIWLGGIDITNEINSGRMGALVDLRDSRVPDLVSEMDRLTGTLRDQINALQNDGTAFPPPNSLTGSHIFNAADTLVAAGNIRIAVTDSAGKYVDDGGGSPDYADIDLSALTAAVGGTLTVQDVIDAINGGVIAGFAGVPGVTASLSNGNLVVKADNPAYGVVIDNSDVDGSLGTNGSVDATGVTTGGDITTFPAPTIALATSGISQAAGTALQALLVNGNLNLAVETTAGAPGAVRLAANSRFTFGPLGGGAGSSLGLPVSTASGDLAAGGTVEVSFDSDGDGTSDTVIGTLTLGAATLNNPTVGGAQGSIAIQGIDITRNATVQVAGGTQSFNQFFGLNDFFTTGTDYDSYSSGPQTTGTSPLTLAGTLSFSGIFGATTVNYTTASSLSDIAAAVNANGALQAANIAASVVTDGSNVRLKIADSDGNNFSLTDSGTLLSTLNFGTDTTGIVQALQVRSTLANNPSLISRAQLDESAAPAIGAAAVTAGDGSIVQSMANAFTSQIAFPAAGALGKTTTTLGGYATSILSLNAVDAANVTSTQSFKSALVQNLQNRFTSSSGVNIDEELSNMIVFQNAYTASARVITTAADMLKTLTDMV
jgi:flagellar hook-associated protein 1 FlgK